MFPELDENEAIRNAIKSALSERILLEMPSILDSDQNDQRETQDLVFSFASAKWLRTVLSTMLDERIRYLHKSVAESLEVDGNTKFLTLSDHLKIFEHWKKSGNIRKTIVRALIICDLYPDWNFHHQCLFLLNASFLMLREKIGDFDGLYF